MAGLNIFHKYYTMDPKTEGLLSSGRGFADGMIVLIASPDGRVDMSRNLSEPWMQDRALENNCWAKISEIKFVGSSVSFVATYEDGTMRKRSSHVDTAWLVKIDSLPKKESTIGEEADRINNKSREELRLAIYRLVSSAMRKQGITYHGESATVSTVSGDVTDEIMKLL